MSKSPKWIEEMIPKLQTVLDCELGSYSRGWCCTKHELEFSPEELELCSISVSFRQHQHPEELLRVVYKIARHEAQSAKYVVVHMRADQTGFVLAVKPRKEVPDDEGELNVPL